MSMLAVLYEHVPKLTAACDQRGLECLTGCKEAIDNMYNAHPCLENEDTRAMAEVFIGFLGEDYRAIMDMVISCLEVDPKYKPENKNKDSGKEEKGSLCSDGDPSSAVTITATPLLVLLLVVTMMF